ncbi:hypothetical protein ACHAXM_011355 [Skeletonema potamos]
MKQLPQPTGVPHLIITMCTSSPHCTLTMSCVFTIWIGRDLDSNSSQLRNVDDSSLDSGPLVIKIPVFNANSKLRAASFHASCTSCILKGTTLAICFLSDCSF